jgi:Ca-activated chloride channel family protein
MFRGAALAGVIGLVLSAAVAAQVFRGGTDLVLLSVTVTDSAGRHVAGLTREDFRVYEDQVLQEISHFSSEPSPISLSLLIDTSTSMDQDSKLTLAQQAASGFVNKLRPNDVAQILDFDSMTKILAEFTGDKTVLENALKQMKAGGSTSLYNAIYTALSELRRTRGQFGTAPRRQAIVLLSDGEDTSSVLPSDDVIDLARRSEVIIYAIAIKGTGTATRAWAEAETVLRSLTRDTGGRLFIATEPQQLAGIYGQVAEELANQYTVAYMSTNSKKDGTWRKISMQVLKGDAMPRTRAGYYASTAKSPAGPTTGKRP